MSTIATSGRWSRVARRSASASPDRGSRDPLLRDETEDGATRQAPAVGPGVAAGGQHDHWSLTVVCQRIGDLESFDIGQPDVQQHEVGLERPGGLESGGTVSRLSDHLEPV
jgi:hypothetical protein